MEVRSDHSERKITLLRYELLGSILRCHPYLKASSSIGQRCVDKDHRLSLPTSSSAFHESLNRAVFGAAFRRYGKRLRVLPVLEKGEVRTRTLRSWEFGKSGRWHIHCAIELPSHIDAIALEKLIRKCWAKVEWGYSRILIRDGANEGWINYMLKGRQKSAFDNFLDCIVIESLHNPIADA